MIDDATIKKLGDEYARVMIGIETLLDDELDDDESCGVEAAISRHLIRVELGRPPTIEEFGLLREHMGEALQAMRGQ